MLATAKAHYDKGQIVLENNEHKMVQGQELAITYYVFPEDDWAEKVKKRREYLDSKSFVAKTNISAEEIDRFIREGREDRDVF